MYIVIENGNKIGDNVPENPDCITSGFATMQEAKDFILADGDSAFDVEEGMDIGQEIDYGSRYTIAKVCGTFIPQPTLNVTFRLHQVFDDKKGKKQ